ncbi:MAG: PhoH family protein, partial [Candidatus Eremiobacteraeota bacterium]|nr:PhoH family protein [Candidatus Eremiobacteraeota bacterium]
QRIILSRPAVEAGEKLGFLPGDLQEKVDPYLRPLFDALGEILEPPAVTRAVERGQIELAPLAYMRGRTLSDSFIVLDEAQNTTNEQMKMFLTRIGAGSRMLVCGDVTQIDLPSQIESGLVAAARMFEGVADTAIVQLGDADIVRHPLIRRIIDAYQRGRR